MSQHDWRFNEHVQPQRPFGRLDADGNGNVTKDEVLKAFSTVDKNGDGNVTRQEFVAALFKDASVPRKEHGEKATHPRSFGDQPANRRHGPPSAESLLKRFDQQNKGSLSKSDLPDPLWKRLSKADSNGDGVISLDELKAYFKVRMKPEKPKQEVPQDKKPAEEKPTAPNPQAQNQNTDEPADAAQASNLANITAR